MKIDISDIARRFPDFRVAVIVATGLEIPADRPVFLTERITAAERQVRDVYGKVPLSEIPGIACWRHAYRQFGIRKTSYRSAIERLVKNTIAGRALPSVNPLVDTYNAVSLRYILPAGADDLDHVLGDLAFRYARAGDTFQDMGARDAAGAPVSAPPKPGEVVYSDSAKILCRRWNWRQDARSVIAPVTRSAVLTLQDNAVSDDASHEDRLVAAAADLSGLIGDVCGGSSAITIVDGSAPVREIAGLSG